MDPMGNALARSDLLRIPSHKDDQQLEKLAGKSGTANHQGLSVPTIKTKTLANAGQRCCLFWLVSIWDIWKKTTSATESDGSFLYNL